MSYYGVIHVVCFYGLCGFTDGILQSTLGTAHIEASTGASEAVDNMSGVAVDEIFVLVNVVCFQVCEHVGTYDVLSVYSCRICKCPWVFLTTSLSLYKFVSEGRRSPVREDRWIWAQFFEGLITGKKYSSWI